MAPQRPLLRLEIEHLRLPEGWASPGFLELEAGGAVRAAGGTRPPHWEPGGWTRHRGYGLPGLANLHSHAFQRALVGRAEGRVAGGDSFWAWREGMYRLAEAITPGQLADIARHLYVELLEGGYTAVGEFHYLHHGPGGAPYDDPLELSLRVAEAAEEAGLALTHLPVYYGAGGIGRPLEPHQRRFAHAGLDAYLRLQAELDAALTPRGHRVGAAPHSLRAVPPAELRPLVEALPPGAPIHLHIAEQRAEVEAVEAALGARPVAWLLEELPVDGRWCLVHATHLSPDEISGLAASGAIAGLCPTTEANLGDGLFPAPAYLEAGGRFGVGSDSQVAVSPADELRWLELGQRLFREARGVLEGASGPGIGLGEGLYLGAAAGGAAALGLDGGALEVGRRGDLVILSPDHPRLAGLSPGQIVDAWLFGAAHGAVDTVYVQGRKVVEGGRHPLAPEAKRRYEESVGAIWERR